MGLSGIGHFRFPRTVLTLHTLRQMLHCVIYEFKSEKNNPTQTASAESMTAANHISSKDGIPWKLSIVN
jgi:hypothetical protein